MSKAYKNYFPLPNVIFALGLSPGEIAVYFELADKGFITIEPTSVITKTGQKCNGSYRYTICPIQEAIDLYHQRQLRKLEIDTAKSRLTTQTAV